MLVHCDLFHVAADIIILFFPWFYDLKCKSALNIILSLLSLDLFQLLLLFAANILFIMSTFYERCLFNLIWVKCMMAILYNVLCLYIHTHLNYKSITDFKQKQEKDTFEKFHKIMYILLWQLDEKMSGKFSAQCLSNRKTFVCIHTYIYIYAEHNKLMIHFDKFK